MSDQPPADKPADKPKGPKGPKALIALVAINLGATGFTAFKVMTAPHAEAAPAEPHHQEPLTKEVVGPVIALEPFVVNLDEPGQARYLKLTLQLELISPEAENTINKNKQLIRDSILSYVSGLKHADTLGSAAKEKLRTDIMTRLESIVGPNQVRRMFFQEFVVQ